jgi:hypothetical protein
VTLPDFVTPIPSGLEPCEETKMELPPEVRRDLEQKLKEFALHHVRALVSSRNYVVR